MSDEKSNGQNNDTLATALDAAREARNDAAAADVLAATTKAAERGARFTLATLAAAPAEVLHRVVRASIPAPWRASLPSFDYFTAEQWRLILTWGEMRYVLGRDAGMLMAIEQIEADDAAKAAAESGAQQTPR